MSIIVDFGKVVKIVTREAVTRTINIPEESVEISSIIIENLEDDGNSVYANVLFDAPDKDIKHVLLWDDTTTPTYKEIGQWEDKDVLDKLKNIYATES